MLEKPAPASVILKELLEDRKASREQQMWILENHRQILVEFMKSFSQKTLGQLACLDSGDGFYHELRKDSPPVINADNEFNLDTRGFFAGNLFSQQKDGQRLAFGVDQESWLLLKISYFNEGAKRVWPHNYEKAASVQVLRVELPTILEEMNIDPTLIWMFFKLITEEWISNRKSLYDQACAVAKGMNEEDSIFRMIS